MPEWLPRKDSNLERENQKPLSAAPEGPFYKGSRAKVSVLEAAKDLPKGKIEICNTAQDAEILGYSHQLWLLLVEAGYDAVVLTPLGGNGGGTAVGLHLLFKDPSNLPPRAAPLQKALLKAGISAPASINPDCDLDVVQILVARKPG